ncbi:MAG: hypothetical protein Q9227_003476 [Pyrenula ochraceoflavens]
MTSIATTPQPINDTTSSQSSPDKRARPPLPHSVSSDGLDKKEMSQSPTKHRSLSDVSKPPTLSPSPALRESRATKDDISISITSPTTPRRPNFPISGLSLQMPHTESNNLSPRIPLSPKLDSSNTYGSPASVLPRRSRGLDFARACTNLHLSTLAESSPDSSPTVTGHGNRAVPIPHRRSFANMSTVLDSPSNLQGNWSNAPPQERTNLSSSVSSVNMFDSESDSPSTSDGEAMDRDNDDMILTTPQVSKLGNNLISPMVNSPGTEWMNTAFSPAASSLMSFQRARFRRNHRSRHSSSSASGRSSRPSPGPLSPTVMKSVEPANGGFFGSVLSKQQVKSRRESLSLGTNELHLSDSDDVDGKVTGTPTATPAHGASAADNPKGVIRRAVTRRGNLLPKTKNFARIKAALIEESAPIDSEAKREAEVIHQVRESDPIVQRSQSEQAPSRKESMEEALEDVSMGGESSASGTQAVSAESFSQQVERNSGGLKFWNDFDGRYRTPPPHRGSSGLSEDLHLDTPPVAQSIEGPLPAEMTRSRSSTPMASHNPTAADVARKVNKKRRRDDDLDPQYLKRRAVSPGMSVASSPVLPQSPVFNSDRSWGHPPPKTNGRAPADRSNSGSSTKRVGLQGMTETNDSLMNMSIE